MTGKIETPQKLSTTLPNEAGFSSEDKAAQQMEAGTLNEPVDHKAAMRHRIMLGVLFAAWYALNVGYNITNKESTKKVKNFKISLGWFQFFIGVPYVLFLWATGIRKMPKLSGRELLTLAPLGIFHCLTHMSAVFALAAGSVSFTHIIKAGEPVTMAIFSAIVLQEVLAWQVYASLIPVIVGISITSCSQVEFSWIALVGASLSTLGSTLRGIYSKKVMVKPIGENLTPANLYGVLTIMSWLYMTPIFLFMEAASVPELLSTAAKDFSPYLIAFHIITSAICYYLYNEVAFMTLHHVSPVTHAVANTFKRVFIILAAYFYFSSEIAGWGWFGAVLAVGGVFVYSLCKLKYKKQK